jgi:hypothetical protein
MKFFVSLLLTSLAAFACGLYLPWWSVALAPFVVAVCIYQRPYVAFLSGFAGIFLLWLILSLTITSSNHYILAPKVSIIIGLGGSVFMLVIITCIVGSIAGGLGALTGSLLRRVTG